VTDVEQKPAPIASAYLREPKDLLLTREVLRNWDKPKADCLYVGIATGEDFYSWLSVGTGLPVRVNWIGLELCQEAIDIVFPHVNVPLILGDYRTYTGKYDIVVANYIWNHRKTYDDMSAIVKLQPTLAFVRDHGLQLGQLKEFWGNDYKVYEYEDDNYRYPMSIVSKEEPVKLWGLSPRTQLHRR
jgi:hypothetical protein